MPDDMKAVLQSNGYQEMRRIEKLVFILFFLFLFLLCCMLSVIVAMQAETEGHFATCPPPWSSLHQELPTIHFVKTPVCLLGQRNFA